MKKNLIYAAALLLSISGASPTRAQDVTLGDVTFVSASDQVPAEWYWPMPDDVTSTFEGFGENAGLTRTERFSRGETVSGVKTVKRHVEGSTEAVLTEDWWLGADTNGDMRVLRLVRAGAAVFEASPTATPPLLLPGSPAAGQTWDLFGTTMTVDWVALSFSGAKVKVTQTAGIKVTSQYYSAGVGATYAESGSASGWRRRTQEATPSIPPTP